MQDDVKRKSQTKPVFVKRSVRQGCSSSSRDAITRGEVVDKAKTVAEMGMPTVMAVDEAGVHGGGAGWWLTVTKKERRTSSGQQTCGQWTACKPATTLTKLLELRPQKRSSTVYSSHGVVEDMRLEDTTGFKLPTTR